jgi:1-deoxy-D-xylulose-5-phosphate synthase
VDVYNVRFLAPLDEDCLALLCAKYEGIVIVEDGVRVGGFGESVAALLARKGVKTKIEAYGFERNPFGQASREELLARAGLDAKGIRKALGDMLQSLGLSPQALSAPAAARIGTFPVSSEVQHVH